MITRQTASGRCPVSFPDSAEFEIPLTTSVIPLAWFGSVTYTRATPATVIDHEWRIVNVKSGEARFTGARRVSNTFAYSQELTNAAWTVGGITRALHTETINGIPTYSLLDDATTVVHRTYQAQTFVSGNTYIASYYLKQNTLAYAQIYLSGVSNDYANFDLSTGTVSAGTAGAGSISSLGNGWYRCSLKFTTTSGGSNAVNLITINSGTSSRAQSYLGTGVWYYASAAQLEDVTGQSIKTVGDYVSTNVLSSPFHGAMVDWVKYFNTTLTGDTISASTLKWVLIEWTRTNLFTHSNTFSSWTKNLSWMTVTANQWTGPDGANSLWKIATAWTTWVQWIILGATVTSAVHTFTIYAKAGENSVLQLRTQWTLSYWYVNFDLSDGTVGSSSLWTGSITPVAWFPWIYKCVAITNTLVAGTGDIYISQVPTKTTELAGSLVWDWVSGMYLWWAQLELWSMSTSHIFTTGSTVTRNDDALSYNVSNAVSVKGAAYLEFTMWFVPTVWVDRRVFWLTANTNNRLQITGSSITTNTTIITVGNGSAVLSTNLWNIVSTNTYSKVAVKWTNGWVANMFQNGSKSTNISSPSVAVTQIDVGNVGGAPLFWYIKNLKVWKSPPSDSELQALTTL